MHWEPRMMSTDVLNMRHTLMVVSCPYQVPSASEEAPPLTKLNVS